ncbi:hypothetical protein DQG23_19795 [Paenibacillus contaminans]|uniref:SLH domain-containing protein n=2 Tax=Paenibacillus contaminans TaxID=450362 RepID=A0A329MKA4_9BACL|nr:hypothetical protein DQG23_19795 [Paenibacillus contaminans]
MIVMVTRALAAAGAPEIRGNSAALDNFTDADQISGYASESLAGMVEQGLIEGAGGKLNPLNQATRAETAVFLIRVLDFLSK